MRPGTEGKDRRARAKSNRTSTAAPALKKRQLHYAASPYRATTKQQSTEPSLLDGGRKLPNQPAQSGASTMEHDVRAAAKQLNVRSHSHLPSSEDASSPFSRQKGASGEEGRPLRELDPQLSSSLDFSADP